MKLMNLKNFVLGTLLTTTSLASANGGVSGGGGGTLPSNPVSTYFIEKVIQEAKRDLRLFIKYELLRNDYANPTALEKKLFGGTKNLWDVLEETNIELRETRPCYDSANNEVDGSIYSNKKNHICISSFRIAPKLIKQNARIETLALILHELTHLLGADEKEATSYQQMAVQFFNETREKTAWELASRQETEANNISQNLKRMSDIIAKGNISEIAKNISEISARTNEYFSRASTLPFSTHDYKERSYLNFQINRLMVATWVADNRSNPEEPYYKFVIDKVFQGKKSISYREFKERHYSIKDGALWDNKSIDLVETDKELAALTDELSEYFFREYEMMFSLVHDLVLPQANLPTTTIKVNPWDNFIGRYEIVKKECQYQGIKGGNEGVLFGFEVYRRADGKLELRNHTKEGWFDLGGLYDGAGDVLGGALVTVSGNKTEAKRTAKLNTGYFKPYQTKEFTLKAVNNNEYVMNTSIVMNGSYTDHTAPDATGVCEFKLNKK